MKKVFALFAFTLLVIVTKAQDAAAYSKGSSMLNVGVGIGTLYWGSGFSNDIGVNPTASYEYGATDKISVGGEVSYSGVKFNYGDGTIKYSGTLIGARGSYHFATSEKLDPYFGLVLGYVTVSVKDKGGFAGSAKASGLGWGAHLGARYYFSDNVGVHAELGYSGFSILTAGVSFKF